MGKINPQTCPQTFYRYLKELFNSLYLFIQVYYNSWIIFTKKNFDFDAKPMCYSRALKCHSYHKRIKKLIINSKNCGKIDYCKCLKQKIIFKTFFLKNTSNTDTADTYLTFYKENSAMKCISFQIHTPSEESSRLKK